MDGTDGALLIDVVQGGVKAVSAPVRRAFDTTEYDGDTLLGRGFAKVLEVKLIAGKWLFW